jgi:hypothetical protein
MGVCRILYNPWSRKCQSSLSTVPFQPFFYDYSLTSFPFLDNLSALHFQRAKGGTAKPRAEARSASISAAFGKLST